MEEKKPGFIRRSFRLMGRIIGWLRVALVNLFFLLSLVMLVVLLSSGELPSIPEKGALILNPQGVIVDQLSFSDPLKNLMGESNPEDQETLLQDMLDAILLAKDDKRITSLVMELDFLAHAGISKMQEIATALEQFRASGKKIIAVGDYYTQDQYWLATQADEVYMHPMGAVFMEGYGLYRNYFKNALDKLQVNFHVFRVGEYKSALEPFIRQDMSAEAKEANLAWLNVLWQQYVQGVAEQRDLRPDDINRYINGIDKLLAQYQGNTATAAMAAGLVDGLKTRDESSRYLASIVGAVNEDGLYEGVGFERYLWVKNYENHKEKAEQQIGIIVAQGMIVDGEQPAGTIGGDSLAKIIRQASQAPDVKAVVLRIDSGGGSAFASEVIRSELLLLKEAGKPLVVSMGSMAASGGYWIASPADEIWATPTTLTGSIGIFGAFPTLEKTYDKLGINTDGVGTTQLAGAMRVDRPLQPLAEKAIQSSIEYGYRRFIEIVAEGRDMTKADVQQVAEGRVWSGVDAQQLGLVDQLGGLDDAVESAARLASLEKYERQVIERPLSPREKILKQLTGVWFSPSSTVFSQLNRWLSPVMERLSFWQKMNDPKGVYLYCSDCIAP